MLMQKDQKISTLHMADRIWLDQLLMESDSSLPLIVWAYLIQY